MFGALALSYDLLIGFTGIISFGHALYFALGAYGTNILVTHAGLALVPASLLAVGATMAIAMLTGAIALRVTGIIFALVTLAFAQAFAVVVHRNPGGLTGGEEGLGLDTSALPTWLAGLDNTRNLYWIALGILLLVYAVVWVTTQSEAGRVWVAIRDNTERASVLGYEPYGYKLVAFALSCALAGVCGVVYLLLLGSSGTEITRDHFSLTILLMVILGGAGYRWAAVAGGVVFYYLETQMNALAQQDVIQQLPTVLKVPLQEPLFLLGSLLMLVVLFLPGGIAELAAKVRNRLGPTKHKSVG